MTLNELLNRLIPLQAEHGDKQAAIMLEIPEPRMQINDVVMNVATSKLCVILIGTEWE